MSAIRWAALAVFAICMGLTITRMTVDGITVLAAAMAGVIAWTYGAFTRDFWISDDPKYARVDRELNDLSLERATDDDVDEWQAALDMWDRDTGAR